MQPLAADGLRLEPLTQSHATALYPLLADPELYRYMDYGPPQSVQALAQVYRQLEARHSPDGAEVWLNWVVMASDDVPVGVVQATVMAGHRSWVAYVFGRRYWGQGYGRMATAAMLAHLAQAYAVTQFLATVERAHARSLHLLHALGFEVAADDLADSYGLSPSEVLLVREASVPAPKES